MEGLIGLTERETYPQIKDVINQARPLIFDFDFPIFDEAYRIPLENKILKTYYTREICDTPVSRWKLLLDIKLNEIMPYMNQLYKSELLAFDPFTTVNYSRDYSRKRKDDETGSAKLDFPNGSKQTVTSNGNIDSTSDSNNKITDNGTTNQKNRHSDTPQGTITNLEAGTYMTSADVNDSTVNNTRQDDGSTTTNTNSRDTTNTEGTNTHVESKNDNRNLDSTESYLESIKGKDGSKSYPELLTELRNSFLNIDLMILNELNELFFMIY